MKKAELVVLIGFISAIVFCSMSGFSAECKTINENVFRLHILANSDSEEDQELKIQVRDRILEETENIFADGDDLISVERSVEVHLTEIEETAADEIELRGYSYPVKATVVNMWFATRTYDNVTLPAGNYDALRIEIGEAEGQNWWCVLYPALCVPAAEGEQEMEDVLEQNQIEIVNSDPKYEVRFAILEWWEGFKQFILT